MSSATPRPYNVVYDSDNGLQYEFATGYLPISVSGSGTVNSAVANKLAYYAATGTAVSGLAAITAARALASDANGLPVASATTATELGYVSGVTNSIQPQINAKITAAGDTVTGLLTYQVPPIWPHVNKASADSPITVDARTVTQLNVSVDGDLTINGPTSAGAAKDGQKITIRLAQDSTGHAVTLSSDFRFGTDITSYTASGANKTDYIGIIWNYAASKWDVVSIIQGF
jgi:hypothetical protein